MMLAATSGDRVAYAFTLGMVSALNPCGFALLPAYLSYYLGQTGDESDRADHSAPVAAMRAVGVGAALTAGFLLVFGIMGVIWSSVASTIGSRLPWVTAAMGVAVIGLGIAMLFGYEPVARLPKLNVGKGGQEAWSTFLFGISYAVASLSCTLPLFTLLMTATFDESFASGIRIFIWFGLGMGALVTVLTIAVALTREGLVRALRGLMPHFGRISGALLVVTGAIVAYYGWAETRQLDRKSSGTGFATRLQRMQSSIQSWIESVGAPRLGVFFGLVIVAALGAGWWFRSRRRVTTGP